MVTLSMPARTVRSVPAPAMLEGRPRLQGALKREGSTEVTDVLAVGARGGFGGLLDGWSRGDILALAGVVVAVIGVAITIVPPSRHFVKRLWRAAMLRAGLPRRRYAKWFTDKWGVYENPYLDDIENLDLRNTYVPLSLHVEGAPDTLTIATDVLAQDAGNLIIDGGPGSGKSTLLKAYGVGVLQHHALLSRRLRLVPFFLQLRKLAGFLAEDKGIIDYLIDEILVSGAGMSPERAMCFLRYSLSRQLVVVMFDGLDEVIADRYEAVVDAVFHFKDDNNPDCPTRRARLFLTCRRQNFLSLREDWVPAFARRECSLAPLRNSEIFSYLDKVRPKFKMPDGPENFMQAVRASGTLDLHRMPLILAMSVGFYARRDYFEIPSSIAELYRAMIREMLDRHSFRRDHADRRVPGEPLLVYSRACRLLPGGSEAVHRGGESRSRWPRTHQRRPARPAGCGHYVTAGSRAGAGHRPSPRRARQLRAHAVRRQRRCGRYAAATRLARRDQRRADRRARATDHRAATG